MNVAGGKMSARQRQNFAIEVEILKKIGRHNFVVEFFGLSFDTGDLLTSYCVYIDAWKPRNFLVLLNNESLIPAAFKLIFRRGRLDAISKSVKLTQVSIDLLPIQPCTLCLDSSRGRGFRQLVTPNRSQYEYNKILIFFLKFN